MPTHFSGPVVSAKGFQIIPVLTSELPTLTADDAGTMMAVTDNGAGNNELAVVVWNGAEWTLTTGVAISSQGVSSASSTSEY